MLIDYQRRDHAKHAIMVYLSDEAISRLCVAPVLGIFGLQDVGMDVSHSI